MQMPEHFSEWNEEMVARHDPEAFHQHTRGVVRFIEGVRVRQTLELLGVAAEHRVLDAGCGAGHMLEHLQARERHGLDLSRRMVKRARKRLGAGVAVVHGDAEKLPYRDARFDRVLCSSVLSHVLRPERVLAECWRVLKPGGRLAVSVSHEDAIERGIRWARVLGLGGLLLGANANATTAGDHVYASEYHLHHFDLNLLREAAAALPPERALKKVPTFLYPVHLLAVYEKA